MMDTGIVSGVRASLPDVDDIADAALRDKVIEAWAFSLEKNGMRRIEDMRASGFPTSPVITGGTQADHILGVTRMALALADSLAGLLPTFTVDRDILLACGLCHDVGKPFEFNLDNHRRWEADPAASGFPAIRHPAYGVYVALTAGLPEAVVHAAGYHSAEGEQVVRSLETTIVHHCDRAFWRILERSGGLADE